MNPSPMDQPIHNPPAGEADFAIPNIWRDASFFVRSNGLRAIRAIRDSSRTAEALKRDSRLLPFIAAESVTPLRYVRRPEERAFEEGKIKNLRLACERITGLIIEPAGEFSFWRAVGRPSRAHGFVIGREIREGCLIPTIGGGLCQLSGSLYAVATQSGSTILERHGHTRRLQDAYFDESRDATIFWNYVDLRFSAGIRFQLETYLTDRDLVVRLRTERPMERAHGNTVLGAAASELVSDCLSCGREDCHQYQQTRRFEDGASRVVIADRLSPESNRFLQGQLKAHDLVLSPIHQAPLSEGSHAVVPVMVKTFPWTRLKRSVISRLGARRKIAAWVRIAGARLLAHRFEREIRQRPGSYLFIEQELLPHLWIRGALSGRKFCVLASRLPSSLMQRRLDALYEKHPDRDSLREFRMESAYCEAEDEALGAADRIVSSHEEVVQSIPRCERLPWEPSRATDVVSAGSVEPDAFLFPAITAAREGAYEVRAAALELGLSLVAYERNIEQPDFWQGVDITFCSPDSIPWERIAAVIHPAAFISFPRAHLRAIASGVPVLASRGCGLPPGQVTEVITGSPQDLILKIRNGDWRSNDATQTN